MRPVLPTRISQSIFVASLLGVALGVASPAWANDFPILVQTVTVAGGKVSAVNAGPFQSLITTLQNNGTIPMGQNFINAGNPNTGTFVLPNRFTGAMFNARNFGSDGFGQGVYFQNLTGTTVDDVEVTMRNLTDTFAGSTGNADWKVTVTPPNAGANMPATMSITATGAGLPKDAYLWLKIPGAPPNTDATKPAQFNGKLTTKNPLAPGADPPPTPLPLSIGPSVGSPSASYNSSTGTLAFTDSTINFARYLDGSSTTSNGPTESIIGASLRINPTTFLGPDPSQPGVFDFADTFIQVSQGSTLYEDGTLGDIQVFPGSNVPGDTSELFGTLTWQDILPGLGSQYLDQNLAFAVKNGLFFDSDIAAVTNGFTQDGSSPGSLEIATISAVPEPSTLWLMALGVLPAVGRAQSLRRRLRRI